MLKIFIKSLKGSQTLNKQHLALACPVPLAKQPQAQYWGQPASVQRLGSPRCLQAQDKWQLSADHFVAHTRCPWARHREQVTLAYTRDISQRPQNQHTQWRTSDHIRALLNHLHK